MPPASAALSYPNLPCRFTTLALLLREMLHSLGRQQADVLGISWGGGLGFATLPLAPLIPQRTLVLTGDQDPIIPVANGRILAAGIPFATLRWLRRRAPTRAEIGEVYGRPAGCPPMPPGGRAGVRSRNAHTGASTPRPVVK